jgi:hypothetical protein
MSSLMLGKKYTDVFNKRLYKEYLNSIRKKYSLSSYKFKGKNEGAYCKHDEVGSAY